MQFNSMRAWKDAYRASLNTYGGQMSELELSDADLAMVQGAASANTSTSSSLNGLRQYQSGYPQSYGTTLHLGDVSGLLSYVLGGSQL